MNEYAVYRGEEYLVAGTLEECASHLNVKPETVYYYSTPTYQRRFVNPDKRLISVKLEEDEDD